MELTLLKVPGSIEEPEVVCSDEELQRKVATLAGWLKDADEKRFVVLHMGAGGGATLYRHYDPLVALERCGFIDWTVTQSCDGLLHKSGYAPEKLSELYGNIFKEICLACGAVYYRDFPVEAEQGANGEGHRTGRMCEDQFCRGDLVDNLVNFGELLNDEATAQAKSKRATISIAVGTKLVPATTSAPLWEFLPHYKKKSRGKVVVVNPYHTPTDKEADLVIHHKGEPFFRALLSALNVQIPPRFVHYKGAVQK